VKPIVITHASHLLSLRTCSILFETTSNSKDSTQYIAYFTLVYTRVWYDTHTVGILSLPGVQ